jgi:hypothetical protein
MFIAKGLSRVAPVALALSAVFLSLNAHAEPYLAVYKGMQCSSCHANPAGGGKRTAYGNAFAQSELPARRPGPEDAGLWTGEISRWLSVGADLRADYRYVDAPNADAVSEFRVSRGALYIAAELVPGRLSLYVDQQFAPGSSLNREAYVRLNSGGGAFYAMAGQFFLPYGLRLQDDTAFIRQATGVNFFNPDRGVQVGYESGRWSTQLSATNGGGGGTETDSGKQFSWVAQHVRSRWRAGLGFNFNDADAGDRQMQNVFFGVRTGPVVWLAEADLIIDDLPSGAERDSIAGLVEGNWLYRPGHNLKITFDYLDPDSDVSENHQTRWSAVWEYTPMQFLQARIGARVYDGVPENDFQNRKEYFAEVHGFF